MSYLVQILADSITPDNQRVTTFKLKYPSIIHSEFLTHRKFSRNSMSRRAIPSDKILTEVKELPFIPEQFTKNAKGMWNEENITDELSLKATELWLKARDAAVKYASELKDLGVHKQYANRLIEPFQWMTTLVTSTDYDNFFKLRIAKDAQPEIRKLAVLMKEQYDSNTPNILNHGCWHLPFINEEIITTYASFLWGLEFDYVPDLIKFSVAKCARVSYLNFDNTIDVQKDLDLFDQLLISGHYSPFEHQVLCIKDDATPLNYEYISNLTNLSKLNNEYQLLQLRKFVE